MGKNKIIRDAIHNNIELNPLELSILDTPEMQRLRNVRQLSLAYLVYPSALHTRFEHSLGTFHLTKTLADRLFPEKSERQLLALSALLHDVGHFAFSHLPENLIFERLGKTHEQLGEEKILGGSIASALEAAGISGRDLLRMHKSNKYKIISSEVGTDRMDYLLRDAYFTGVGYSLIDAERLLLSLAFGKGDLFIEERGLLAAESLLVSRYLMFNAVYNHHAVRIATEMLGKALRIALDAGRIGILDIVDGTDSELLLTLKEEPLIGRLRNRLLFKNAFEKPDLPERSEMKVAKELEASLLSVLESDEFVICTPRQPMGGIRMKILREDGREAEFSTSSLISNAVASLRKASGLTVATDPRNFAKAQRACRKVL